jgi:small subunit ribosomal protein S16
MALKLRLARHGAKKRPFYWIVAADSRAPRDGKFKEKIGTYNPMLSGDNKDRVLINDDRVRHWLSCGAQPTDRVKKFLGQRGIISEFVAKDTPKKSAPRQKAQERAKEKVERESLRAES